MLLASATAAFAQSPSAADGFDPNVDGNVYAVALQPDGKLILAGQFSLVRPNGSAGGVRNNMARLNADGTLDDTFNPNFNGPARALVLQPDGKILVGGDFTTAQPNGAAATTAANRLARLNADGTLDPFAAGITSAGAQVYALLLQPNGTLFVGGSFSTVASGATTATRRNLARFSGAGVVDVTYDPSPNNLVFALAQHVDNKIVVAGGFTAFAPNGGAATTRNRLARLNADGTLDSEFNPNLDNRATALAIQRDGKIVVGGDFATVQPAGTASAITHNRIVRLNVDGTLDAGFTSNASGNVAAIAVQADGSILAGGAFNQVWSAGTSVSSRPYLARYKPDGTVDLTFTTGVNSVVDAFAFRPDGKIVIAGYFTGFIPAGATSSTVRNRVARLNPSGSLDATFSLDAAGRPLAEAVQRDGKLIIGGSFTSVGGVTHNHLARLNADGSVDASFAPDFNGPVLAVLVQAADQKILVGGAFTTIGGETRNFIARLNPSGTIDSEFNPNASAQVATLALQSDGKILLGGSFTTLQPIGAAAPVTRPYVARLNANGSLDTAFHPNADSNVYTIAVQSDGKILLGGIFSRLIPEVDLTPVVTTNKDGTTSTTFPNGTAVARNAIARVNADGTLDTAFIPNPNSTVNAILLQSDGKILIGGSFTGLRPNGATTTVLRNRLARLNTDGTVDAAYDPNANNMVITLALQTDGRLLVGGPFTTFTPNGAKDYTLRKYAARLNTDGTVDATFNLDLSELNGNRVDSWLVLPDGKILVGGNFVSLQPVGSATRAPLAHFARLNANGSLDAAFVPGIGGTTAVTINTLVLQGDGKVVAAGSFGGLGGTTTTNIARFNPEGTPDTTFTTTLGSDGPINAVLVRPGTTSVIPQSKGLAWLNADGTLRANFAPGTDSRINGTVDVFAVQSDGGLIVGGTFTTATGIPGPNLVRFAPNGAIDTNFGPGPNGAVEAIAVQADGKIIVGGTFTTISSTERSYIARLNRDGSLDTGFNPTANGRINAVVIQSDGNILIGGTFTTLNPNATTTTTTTTTTSTPNAGNSTNTTTAASGAVTTTTVSTVNGTTTTTVVVVSATPVTRNVLARLKADGTLDTGYNPNANGNVNAIVLQADGKAVVGGAFTTFQPGATGTAVGRNRIARLNTDGTLDTAYDPNSNDVVNALSLFVDGKIIVGGAFTNFAPNGGTNAVARNFIARLNTDGTLDSNFNPTANGVVQTVATQPDAKVLFGGQFTAVQPNGAATASGRNNVARVNFDGTLDTAFDPNANAPVRKIVAQADGSVLLGGSFTTLQPTPPLIVGGAFNTIGGVASRNLALLGDDGFVSSIFQPNPNGAVNALLIQADGKLVVAGAFTNIAGATRNRLARFNANLTLDAAYNPNLPDAVASLALQADGKIVAAGTSLIRRLNVDGTADTSFSQNSVGSLRNFHALALQTDGKIMFAALNGTTAPGDLLLRLNADGSSDGTFGTVSGPANSIRTIALQADGRILVNGVVATPGSSTVLPVARVTANGVVDAAFNPAPNGPVTTLALQTDGRLIIGGTFTSVGGLQRGGLARLATSTAAVQAITATRTSALWARSGASPELSSVTFEFSTNGTIWTLLGNAGRVTGTANWQLSGLALPASGSFYLRARGVTPSGGGTSSGVIETAREINLSAVAGVGPASNTVATLEIGGVLIDSATGLVVGQVSASPGAGPAISAAPIGTVAAATSVTTVDLGDSRLVNFSARARVAGDGALIAGFAISGPGSHTVLLRGAGPSLGSFGVPDPLAAPRLQLYDASGRVMLENRGWTNPASGMVDLVAAMTRTGAFPFTANTGNDSAAVVTLPPGAYSLQVLDSARGTGGVTLAEVYDAGNLADTSRLMNISLRGDVSSGSGAFISGFILTGNAPKRLLVRGAGPALTKFNVPGTLSDPIVSVFSVSGQLIASNDNWSQTGSDGLVSANTAALVAASTSVGAFALDVGSKDAALSMVLVPGTYTVQVSGAAGATGAALIEVYELP